MDDILKVKLFSSAKTIRLLCLVSVFLFLSTSWQAAIAKEKQNSPSLAKAPSLFISQNVPQGARSTQKAQKMMNKSAFRHRSVQMDRGHLKSKNILLNLFSDTEFIAERTHMKEGPEGEYTWSGKLKGAVHGVAHITVFGDGVAGSISTEDGRLFEINSSPDGRIMIEEVDLDKLPPHADPLPSTDAPFEEDVLDDAATKKAPAIAGDSGGTIDLMVVYTQASRVRYGESGIKSRIINAVDAMNVANATSLVNSRYRLVYMGEVDYVESGSMGEALDRITNKTDGHMDNVHALRDQYGADIVSLVNEDSNGCGIAWVMTPSQLTNNRMARLAFNVTHSGCLSSYTLAHEIGHNEGCAHDRANSNVPGSYDYSYGHRDTTTGFRTIMSYSCPRGACPRIPQFSNPNVSYNGVPTGIDHSVDPVNSTDNARTKNNNETIIANWRQSVETTVPQDPENLNVVALSGTRIDISWADNADNEEGFNLERSPNGVDTWTVIATLTANTTSYSDDGLTGSTTYFYRVQAYNGVGNSAYSSVDSATTLPSGVVAPTAGFTSNVSFLTVNFTDTSTDSDGSIANWSWNFGDGATSSSKNPTHTYALSGTYTVRLTVTDNDGASDTTSKNVTVVAPNQAPNARFTSSVSVLTVNFTDTSTDSDGSIASRSWNFGDGATSTSRNPTHSYASSGIYTVRLTVTDNDGASDTLSKSVTVTAPNQAPTAGFSYRTSGLTVNFTDTSSDRDGSIASRSWNFGDGRVSTSANPSHTFASTGSYTVRLTVTDDDGASNSLSKRVIVLNPSQNQKILYIFCFLYGCDSNTVVASTNPNNAKAVQIQSAKTKPAKPKPAPKPKIETSTVTSKAPVSSVNSSSNNRSTIVASTRQSPAAPSNLTVSVQTSGRSKTKTATLKWIDNSSNELEFVIERCEQKGKTCNFVEWDTVPAGTTVYKDAPVKGTYKYRVKARNSANDSAKSKEVKI